MNFDLNEEQQLLADMLSGFLRTHYNFAARRMVIAAGADPGASLWPRFAEELGILGALVPAEAGGLGGGAVEAMILMQAAGHALLIEPLMESAIVAVDLLRRAGGRRAKRLLGDIAAGTAIVALAHTEALARHAPTAVAARAEQDGGGWRLTGTKAVVAAAPWATQLIVSAQVAGEPPDTAGVGLFIVDATYPGVVIRGYRTIDSRQAAEVDLAGALLPPDAYLQADHVAEAVLAPALDAGAAALCAEAVGVLRELHGQTLDYVRQRRQFGRAIGEFQVIQHRLADMYIAVEEAVSLTYMATLKLAAPPPERMRAVPAASLGVAKALRFVAQNAVQLHGGIGMTEELALSHYFRRATAIEIQLGSRRSNLQRFMAFSE